jgi:hypothetical protein
MVGRISIGWHRISEEGNARGGLYPRNLLSQARPDRAGPTLVTVTAGSGAASLASIRSLSPPDLQMPAHTRQAFSDRIIGHRFSPHPDAEEVACSRQAPTARSIWWTALEGHGHTLLLQHEWRRGGHRDPSGRW